MTNFCPNCGAAIDPNKNTCEYCGTVVNQPHQSQPTPPPINPQAFGGFTPQGQPNQAPVNSNLPVKSKIVAAILALIFGSIGVHKFYLGQAGKGILYLLFCWTYIPSLVGFIEGIILLTMSDATFMQKYKCRLQ